MAELAESLEQAMARSDVCMSGSIFLVIVTGGQYPYIGREALIGLVGSRAQGGEFGLARAFMTNHICIRLRQS